MSWQKSEKMGQNSCFEKFKNAILENLLHFNEKDEHCDLEVHCSDGVVLVHGLVFVALCPPILLKREMELIKHSFLKLGGAELCQAQKC